MARYKRRRWTRPDKLECILLVIAGLFVGTIFTVGMGYWNAAIEPEKAIAVTATYDGYEVHHGRRQIKAVDLLFTDHEELAIDGCCVTSDMLDTLAAFKKGTMLNMLVHPNGGDTLLSITADGETILAFEDALKRLTIERWGFFGLGVFCYLCAAGGAYYLTTGKYH